MFKKDVYKEFTKTIAKNQKLAIYGTNKTAEKIYEELRKERPDVEVCFFIHSETEGTLLNLPIYRVKDIKNITQKIDNVIIASYSARYMLQLALRANGIKNPIMITEDMLVQQKANHSENLKKSLQVFKRLNDKCLYKFLAKARSHRVKYLNPIRDRFLKKYPNIIDIYPIEHYFEFINKNAIKTVLDCGAYDGLHSVMFTQEFPNCEKVFMFEPSYNSFKQKLVDDIIQQESRIELVEKAIWKETTTLEFREETECKTGSSIVSVKPSVTRASKIIKIDAVKIDDFVKAHNLKVDFIKMDIENAELQALEGAIETLKTQRPQLAISIYHSDGQFYGIPQFLNNTLENYEYRLGHYSDNFTETVLYAIPQELL